MEMTSQQLLLLLGMKEAEIFLLRQAVESMEKQLKQKQDVPVGERSS